MPTPHSAALPMARGVLRMLLVLNKFYGLAILALLAALLIAGTWTLAAFGVDPSPDTAALLNGMRVIAVLGLVAVVPLNEVILRRLLAMVETVRTGDPFVGTNADRLHAIAWALLGLQILNVVIGTIAEIVSTSQHPLQLDAGFSTSGWLAVLLTFVLARVFACGTLMREELQGTV